MHRYGSDWAVAAREGGKDINTISWAVVAMTLATRLDYLSLPVSPRKPRREKLAFTQFFENLTPLVSMAQILAGFGLITVLLAVLKRNSERRCWRIFKARVEDWTDRLRDSGHRHPRDLDEDEWKAECERMLSDSRFSPLEIHQILDASVIVAKGIAADKYFT